MMEYVVFQQQPLDQFSDYLPTLNLVPETLTFHDRLEVRLPDDLPDTLYEQVDVRYDQLILIRKGNSPTRNNPGVRILSNWQA